MNLFPRQILANIKPFIKRREAIIIKGARQVGKTSLLKLIRQILIDKQGVKNDKMYFFDMEELGIREDFNENPKNILKYISDTKTRQYVFIDEIQYLENPSNFLKILVDHLPNLKIFATGSSSLDIKRKIQDSLIGRAVYFQLYPLNFSEYLLFKKESAPDDPTTGQKTKLDRLLYEYLAYGGFPAVVLEKNKAVKESLLRNYINLYVTKDIKNLAEIENISAFNNLAKVLSGQIGNLLDKNEISNTLNISNKTTSRYIDILQFTYITVLINPYFTNIRSRLTKTPKIYFYDLGFRNALANNFSEINFRPDNGAMFENFIFLELLNKYGQENIFYYRNQQKNEIDFVIEKNKSTVEVKFKKYKGKEVFRVFDLFDKFDNKIVNLNFDCKTEKYEFINWWIFLNEKKS